jgi:ubiquinone biosynthesis protein
VSSSRALITGAREVARFREISTVFVTHGFGWVWAQLKLRRELQVDFQGVDLTRAHLKDPDTGKRLVAALTKLGPSFVKLGQILSTRSDVLPLTLIRELETLQDNVGAVPFADIDGQLVRNLGAEYRAAFSELDETPLASASIAQVHRAKLKDGTPVVLKVQRPDVRAKIEGDLGILMVLARWLEDAIDEARVMDVCGIVTGFTKSISAELDFRIEARNLDRFRANFSDQNDVVFPRVISELSTADVLCMEFLDGRKFSELLEKGEDTKPLVSTYFNTAYKMLFIDGFFHGDLHPGNVLVLPDNRVGVLDCGMVGRLSPVAKDRIIDILYAVLNEDLETVARTFYELSIRHGPVDYEKFEADVVEIAERYLVGVPLSEIQIGTLFAEIVGGATRHNVRMPTDFTMMFKAIITTEGMAKTIAPDTDPLELARPFIVRMVSERYSPDRLKQIALADFNLVSRMFRSLPRTLPAMIDDIRAGKLAISLAPETLAEQRRQVELRTGRLVRTALTVTFLACGTFSLSLGLPVWQLVGIPALSAVLFFAAGVGLFSLLWR